jgi:hypothetical protein
VPRWRRIARPAVVLPLLIVTSAADHWRAAHRNDARTELHGRRAEVLAVPDGITLELRLMSGSGRVLHVSLEGVAAVPDDRLADDADITPREAIESYLERVAFGRAFELLLEDRSDLRNPAGHVRAYLRLVGEGPRSGGHSDSPEAEHADVLGMGDMLNEAIVADGWAVVDASRHCVFQSRFEQYERRARRRGVGLWAAAADTDPNRAP